MKKWLRFVSAVLIASVALSFSAASLAEETTRVFIPNKIGRLVLPDLPEYVALRTRTESVATYGNPDDPTDPCPILPVTGGKIELFFSEQPDWAMVLWAEGPEPLSVSDTGYAQTTAAGHKYQPGWWPNPDVETDENGNTVWANSKDGHIKGTPAPSGRDEAYLAGKDNVVVQYGRSGKVNYVEYTIEDDFYYTGMDGAVTVIRYEPVVVDGDRYIYKWVPERKIKTVIQNGKEIPVRDDNGDYVYEETGRQVKKIDADGNVVLDADGNPVMEPAMQKIKINLKGNVVYLDKDLSEAAGLVDEDGNIFIGDPDNPVAPPAYLTILEDEQLETSNTEWKVTKTNKYGGVVGDDYIVHWYYTTWYISKVTTIYPDNNYIVEVESDWRNDSGQFLSSYKITYSPNAGERYKITYSPRTAVIWENPNDNSFQIFDEGDAGILFPDKFPKEIPSTDMEAYITYMIKTLEDQIAAAQAAGDTKLADKLTGQLSSIKGQKDKYSGTYLRRYDADMPIYGEYRDGTYSLVSGSGDYLAYWYEEGHGRRVRKFGLVPCTSFPSPRIQ